jgi:hypothetical protein
VTFGTHQAVRLINDNVTVFGFAASPSGTQEVADVITCLLQVEDSEERRSLCERTLNPCANERANSVKLLSAGIGIGTVRTAGRPVPAPPTFPSRCRP